MTVPTPAVSITTIRGPGAGVAATAETHQALAGFIVWLAGRRLPGERRRALHHEVDRYLRWQTGAPAPNGPEVYLRQLRQAGYHETDLELARDALRWLHAYHTDDRAHPGAIE